MKRDAAGAHEAAASCANQQQMQTNQNRVKSCNGMRSCGGNGSLVEPTCLLLCLLAILSSCISAAARHTPVIGARPYTWSYLNIHQHSFVGIWNNQSYQADAWLRLICLNRTTHLARMVVSLHSAPFITVSPEGVHSLVPASMFEGNGSLPRFWFQSVDDSISIDAQQLTHYDELIKRHEDAAQLILGAELPAASQPFTLRLEGSERVHMVQQHCGPKQHPLFTNGSVWLGMMDATTVHGAPELKVESKYRAEKPPPPPIKGTWNNETAQKLIELLSSSSKGSNGSVTLAGPAADEFLSLLSAEAGTNPEAALVLQLLGQDPGAAPAAAAASSLPEVQAQLEEQKQKNAVMADQMQLMQMLAEQQQKQALAAAAQQLGVADGSGDGNAAIATLLQQLLLQEQGNVVHGSSSSGNAAADADTLLQLLGGRQVSDAAAAAAAAAVVPPSAPAPTETTDGISADFSSSSSADQVTRLVQRKLLSRSGLYDALFAGSISSSSVNSTDSDNSSSNSSVKHRNSGDDIYFPFFNGTSAATSSHSSDISSTGGGSSSGSVNTVVDPTLPLPQPPGQYAGLLGDYSGQWASQGSSSGEVTSTLVSSSFVPTGSSSSNRSSSGKLHMDHRKQGEVLRFLTLQHLQHHRALGFSGSIMVVTRHTADMIMQSRALRRAMQRHRLILVLWDLGLEPRASHFMQVPAYNLIRLAAWGSEVHLGFWDLDEYLIIPSHTPISAEIRDGCLSTAFTKEPEAIVPTMWVASNSWNSTPELLGWLKHGYWSRAVQTMEYAMWPYTFCDGACKSLLNPNSDLMFQVHQHARPPPRTALWPVSWRCAYMLHFYRLWNQRMPSLMSGMGYKPPDNPAAIPGIPLLMEDILPRSSIQKLASMAKLYKEIVSSNPELADSAQTQGDSGLGGVREQPVEATGSLGSIGTWLGKQGFVLPPM